MIGEIVSLIAVVITIDEAGTVHLKETKSETKSESKCQRNTDRGGTNRNKKKEKEKN